MSDDAEQECPPCAAGLPGWVATFADLMSLLMCFFVLLLSFSEMDVLKFKQLAGSMREAFGVQNQIKVEDIPKGTSIIAQEFSPGRPEPTPLNEVRQMTVNNNMNTLDIRSVEGDSETKDKQDGEAELMQQLEQQMEEEAREQAVQFAQALAQEIGDGAVEVETDQTKVIIRVQEKGSFSSGSAELKFEYIPVMAKIRDVLLDVPGNVSIEGHTDNIPYSGRAFFSNWDLSAARALAVANELFDDERIDQTKYQIIGHADTKPLVPNNTAENRATNRRVEIVIQRGRDKELLEKIQARGLGDSEGESLAPEDIF
ncbi:flagellar motor protein MotB [Neptunomonas phycophila]|jgi:chemotaxis protein MotB|uniref:Flagellar motor protein MotB n=1 Tax=Neptunomonas phycophila TaxID=1572645 RepID=A0AAW7XMM3_9GAMM|nr:MULTISPECIES: flagellar motor protein MotB [Neptunomonas]MDN2660688.1 flagellar motor protein MotB [Neptunomonas sp. CHC150]MDO6455011.1 flagellar motor protein MotB [Neptunomonas phycophila]MDO6468062.1 flagellar motor protein MotB [Neptunomonas phycophila]MDO6784107.1 flagellar motor protein MotB [Neptunomonas phycophila]MDP2523645.1 flagellar motor protein MotB [Neptunomonas phycophila]